MPTNDFLQFATGGGANVESQAAYAADSTRTNGNQPGVASSALNNKAVRQSTYVVSQFAQYLSDITATDILDDTISAKLLAQVNATFLRLPPKVTSYTSGSGNHNVAYWFFIASGSATAAATYTSGGITYTVVSTVASAKLVQMTGNTAPSASGTLTKASGSGDATLTFYAVRAPLYIDGEMLGAGGGGGGSGTTSGTAATAGGDTTFGSFTAGGGGAGGAGTATPGTAGIASTNTTATGTVINAPGGKGGRSGNTTGGANPGSPGGVSFYGGAGNIDGTGTGQAAQTNSGSGGAGAAGNTGATFFAGGGGGAGAYQTFTLTTIASTYAYSVGAAGSAGGAGSTGSAGGAGGAGRITVAECYQ